MTMLKPSEKLAALEKEKVELRNREKAGKSLPGDRFRWDLIEDEESDIRAEESNNRIWASLAEKAKGRDLPEAKAA